MGDYSLAELAAMNDDARRPMRAEEDRRSLAAELARATDPRIKAVLQAEYDRAFSGGAGEAAPTSMRQGFPMGGKVSTASTVDTPAAPAELSLSDFLDGMGKAPKASNAPQSADSRPALSMSDFLDNLDVSGPPVAPKATVMDRVKDAGLALLQGAVAVPQAAVGLADLVTGGHVGKFLENEGGAVGFRPNEATQILEQAKSPAQLAATKRVMDSFKGAPGDDQDFLARVSRGAVAAMGNPSVIEQSILQSLPSMGAGGVIGRGVLAVAPRLGAVASGIGEGVTTMGSQAEQIRTDEHNPSGLLDPTQALLAAGSGAATGMIGAFSNVLAKRLGFETAENLMTGIHANPAAQAGVVKRVLGGAVTEGFMEELPQSVQEQVAQNIATGQPLDKDVDQQAVLGTLSGATMGVGAQAFHKPHSLIQDRHAGDPADVARSNQALDDIAAAPNADAAIEAFSRTHIPLKVPQEFDAEGAMARMERANANDQNLMRDRQDTGPSVTSPPGPKVVTDEPGVPVRSGPPITSPFQALKPGDTTAMLYEGLFKALQAGKTTLNGVEDPVLKRAKAAFDAGLISSPADLKKAENEGYPTAPTDIERMQAKVPETFQDRLEVVKEKLEDSRVRQKLRDTSGRQALDDALYFAEQAGNDQQPGETSDQMLIHTERLLREANVPELPRVTQAGDKAQSLAQKRVDTERQAQEKTQAKDQQQADKSEQARTKARQDDDKARDRIAMQIALSTPGPDAEKAAKDTEKGSSDTEKAPAVPQNTESGAALDAAAHVAAPSPKNDLAEPTQAQKEAGNYQKGHVVVGGLDISVENPQGSVRSGTAKDGSTWSNTLQHHYGYIRGTVGMDKDHIDTFMKPGLDPAHPGPVFVIDQIDPATRKADEHKVMLGFDTIDEAKAAYKANYHAGWNGMRTISTVPLDSFKKWLATGDTKKPFNDPSLRERADEMKARSASPGAASQPDLSTVDKKEPVGVDLGAPVKHTTVKGKDVFGFVRTDMTDKEARAIDPYAFNKDGGKFIRERHQDALEAFLNERGEVGAAKPAGDARGEASKRPEGEGVAVAPAPAVASHAAPDESSANGVPAASKTAPTEPVGNSLKERAQSMKDRIADEANKVTFGDIKAVDKAEGTSLTHYFGQLIRDGKMPKDNPALKKLVELYDRQTPTQARMKEAQETLEAAIVKESRRLVHEGGDMRAKFGKLLALYESQPLLNVRTSTSIENQAYSTPAPLALLASDLSSINDKTTVYEPTAGTGMLLIEAAPRNATVNELNDFRAALLKEQGFKVTQQDATERIPGAKTMNRVITNPPFGPIKNDKGDSVKVSVEGYTLGQIDHLIVARALETMKDDGQATLIIGANQVAGGVSNNDLVFFNWLYGHYNVTGHFEVDGKLYTRQGASWPVRVISIDGREASSRISPEEGVIQRATTWDEVYGQYETSLATGRAGRGLRAGPVSPSAPAADDTRSVPEPAGNQAPAADRGEPAPSPRSDADVGGKRPGPVGDPGAVSDESVGSADRLQRPSVGGVQPDAVGGDAGRPAAGKPDRNARAVGLTDPENQFQAPYTARSSRKDTGVLIPVNMQQPTQDALSALEDAVGDIDEYARKQLGYATVDKLHEALMGLQVDSVASAIYQMSQEKGTIIADQTGIGKGRQAAAIIRWAAKNGRIPVFMSAKPSLFTDMYGDLHDIGTDDVAPLIMNSGEVIRGDAGEALFKNKPGHKDVLEQIATTGLLPEGRNALFSTYSQINVDNVQRRAMLALAPRAIFVLDESHNAAGESATGNFVRDMLDLAKGVVYLSATYAKRPDNMPLYYKTDMGQAVADDASLITAMEMGGLPLQTVVSNNLVRAGQFFRRERSYDGVEILTVIDSENRVRHEALSDRVTEALRAITSADRMFHEVFFKALAKELKKEGARALDTAGNQLKQSVDHTEFSSVVHNFVRQMLLSLEADNTASRAIAALQRGEKPLIALENTMGSFLESYVDAKGIKDGESLGDFGYRNVLSRALERSRVLVRVAPNGVKTKENIPLSRLDPITLQAYTRAQEVIDALKVDLPVSPIDWMRHRLTSEGFSVAEITGRTLTVDYSDPKNPKLSAVDIQEKKDKVRTTRMFNSGKLDAIILNVSGSTGISLHASEKFTDQRPRKMIVAQAAQDINIFMQMLGRIHRTGQVVLPGYELLNADLPAVKRPVAVLSRKMKSLNANTSSNTESATSVKALDMLNKYGDQVVQAYLADNPMLSMELGLGLMDAGEQSDTASSREDLARTATGRIALMPVAKQKEFYAEIESQYETLIDYLNKTNQNELEPRTADFDAREMSSQTIFEGQNQASPFGQDAIYNEFSIKAQGKPFTPAQIKEQIAEHLAGKTGQDHALALSGSLRDATERFKATLTESQLQQAQATIATGRMFIQGHPIGSMVRVDINEEPYVAVVTNIRSTHKAGGNPFSLSKIQVTIAVNGALRSVTVPASRFAAIETSQVNQGSIDRLFREGPADERQTAKIITGNLLGAYGELKGVRGTIISFTKQDGTTDQGILLPKGFSLEQNTAGDFRLPSGEAATLFLQRSLNKDIGRFGIMTRDGVVRVVPANGEIRIAVPASKAKGGKWFLDENLRKVVGDFVSKGNQMVVDVPYRDAPAALDAIMKKQALYTLPSMAEEAKAIVTDGKPRPGTMADQRVSNPDRGARQTPVNPSSSAMKTGVGAADWLSRSGTQPWVREIASRLVPHLSGTNITFLKAGTKATVPTSIANAFRRGNFFGMSEVDPVSGQSNVYMRYAEDNPVGQEDLLHELVHAATDRALSVSQSAPIRAELQSIRTVLQRTFDTVLTSPKASDQARNDAEFFRRTIADEHELLAYGLTSKTFRQWAEKLDATGRFLPANVSTVDKPVLTLWQRFVDVVRSLIGLSKLFQPRLEALLARQGAGMRTADATETLAARLDALLKQTLDLNIGPKQFTDALYTPRAGTAYHGTPHQFDAFSSKAIGSGEGGASFGYGLYFAGRKEVAQHYREALAGANVTYADDAAQAEMKKALNFSDRSMVAVENVMIANSDPEMQAGLLRYQAKHSSGYHAKALNTAAALIEAGRMSGTVGGHVYEVHIPDDHELLDWDAPLSKQTPAVRAALESLISPQEKRRMAAWVQPDWARKPGEDPNIKYEDAIQAGTIYMSLSQEAPFYSQQALSNALREAGVPGIRYLDQGSRDKGKGTSNYVIFDDSRVSIQQRFGTSEFLSTLRGMDRTQARNLFLDAVTGHGSVNAWQRTVGTQYAKAEANPTTFKPVFEAIQDYIKDTSIFANAAADEAPDILPKLDSLADVMHKQMSREDIDAAGKAVFEGTLKWTRDENGALRSIDDAQAHADTLTSEQKARELFRAGLVTEAELKRWQATPLDIYDGAVRNRYEKHLLTPGVIFSDQELKDLFKLPPRLINVYRQFRNATDMSLDDLGRTELVRLAGTTGAAVAKQALGAASMADTAAILSEHIDALTEAEKSPATRDSLTDLRNTINDKANQVAKLKKQGYAPLMRFGEHTVHVTQGGETIYFGLYESGMTANKAARALRDEYRGASIVQGKMSKEAFKLYQGLDLNALELFAETTGQSDNAVYQDFLRLTKNNRSAMKRMIERKGISGFNDNTARVLASFVTSNARMASGNVHMGRALSAAAAIPKEMGDLKDEATKMIKYVQNPGEEAAGMRALLFTNFIGGSVASALVNLTQPFTMSLPYLSQFGGAANASRHLLTATRAAAGGKVSADMSKVLKANEDLVSPQEVHHLQSEAMDRLGNHPFAKKAMFLWGSMFSLSEQFNRRVTFIAAYQTALEQGNPDPTAFARKAVIETQGLYNKGNKANWARGPIGATVMTFKQFSVHYLEFLTRMYHSGPEGKKAAVLALALLMLVGGGGGLPFAEDVDDLVDTLAQAMGYDFSSKKAKRDFIADTLGLGGDAALFITKGLSGVSGMPIDVSLRMGMGNLIPGTGIFLKSDTDRSRDVLEFAGAAGSLAKNAMDAGTLALGGKFAQAGMAVAPLAIQNMAKSADMFNTGEYRNAKGQKVVDVSTVDAAAKFIGFNPAVVANESAKQQEIQRSVQLTKNVESEIAAKWAQGVNENNRDLQAEARADLADWNAKNPEAPMRITMQQVIQRVRDMRASRAERTVKSAPREMRGAVREALQ